MESKRLDLIKVLLKYIIEKNRQEQKFLKFLNDNKNLYNIDIYPTIDMPFYEVAEKLGIIEDKKAEKIFNLFNRNKINVDELVEEFCSKYNI